VSKIKINKKVKDFYEKLTLYHEVEMPSEETSISTNISDNLVAASDVKVDTIDINVFEKYSYNEETTKIIKL
jgi:hypothetical protein